VSSKSGESVSRPTDITGYSPLSAPHSPLFGPLCVLSLRELAHAIMA